MPTVPASWLPALLAAGATDSTPTHRQSDDLAPQPPQTRLTAKARQTRRQGPKKEGAAVTEKQFQKRVTELAILHGWVVYHVPDSRRASAAGFPDLTLAHESRGVIFAELKREGQKPRPSQVWWHRVLRAAGCRVYVWTAMEWDEVVKVLTGEPC